ncbi:MAG TPA: adenylyl-sulfate reductase subunit beta [Gemmatimonadetes bacterium]|nr:adenylyl-sulfate reductase subunit beta [Gemmatimonadota bacterium]
MPSYVNPDKCDGCKALDRPACHYICPNDLMHLDKEQGKSINIEPDLCWECYACVKTCPQSAIDIRAYADIAPMGASITSLRGTDTIMWTVKFRDGQIKRFKLPIRSTPWGSIVPFEGMPDPTLDDLKGQGLCQEAQFLGVPDLPKPALA